MVAYRTTRVQFHPVASNLAYGCSIANIVPSSFILHYLVRNKSNKAIPTPRAIINQESFSPFTTLRCMISGTPISIVVTITGVLVYLLDEWIHSNATARNEAAHMKLWYTM